VSRWTELHGVGLRSDFASINVSGDFIHASRANSHAGALRARAGHSARPAVLPVPARGTIISNKSPPVDVSVVLFSAASGERRREIGERRCWT